MRHLRREKHMIHFRNNLAVSILIINLQRTIIRSGLKCLIEVVQKAHMNDSLEIIQM